MFKGRETTPRSVQPSTRDEDAVFRGWQKTHSGEVFALYTITAAGHPSLGSTVTDRSLLKLNLQIPQTPLWPAKKF